MDRHENGQGNSPLNNGALRDFGEEQPLFFTAIWWAVQDSTPLPFCTDET
jgi:hypothetical protein